MTALAPAFDGGVGVGSGTIFGDENGVRPLAKQAKRKPAATKRISIFGLGYVGAVSLACLARDGHRVVGVDIDATKLDLIRARKSKDPDRRSDSAYPELDFVLYAVFGSSNLAT